VHVVVRAGAVDHDDRVRIASPWQVVPELVGVLPGDVGDAEAAALGSAGGGVSLDPPPQAAMAVATASGAKSTTDFQVAIGT